MTKRKKRACFIKRKEVRALIKAKIDKEYSSKITLDGRSFDLLLEFIVLTINLTKGISKEFGMDSVKVFESVSELIKEKLKEEGV